MPDQKISELNPAGALDGSELVPVVQGTDTVGATLTAVFAALGGAGYDDTAIQAAIAALQAADTATDGNVTALQTAITALQAADTTITGDVTALQTAITNALVSTPAAGTNQQIVPGAPADVPLAVKASGGQSGDLFQALSPTGTTLFRIDANGNVTIPGNLTVTGNLIAPPVEPVQVLVDGYTTDVAVRDGAGYFHISPALNNKDLVTVHAAVITPGAGGVTSVQVHNLTKSVDMLTTMLTIDAAETGSDTAAAAAVISNVNKKVAVNDMLRIDVKAVSPTTAPQGLLVTMEFN